MDESFKAIGPYEIIGRLGSGGMGEVFAARHSALDRLVAIKRIREEQQASSESRQRLRREARLAAKLNHPSIVQVYDVIQQDDFDCIVMEYVEGTSLHQLLKSGPIDFRQLLPLAVEIAEALAEAHRRGIIHRDLKPENILVALNGRAKVTDFGVAKSLLENEPDLTHDSALVGTCRAMSPEQARGEPLDHRSDLFSLGSLLYEALSGNSPFAGENQLATINRINHSQPQPLGGLRTEIPTELSSLVDQLLQKAPLARPRSASEVACELARLAEANPPSQTLETAATELAAPTAEQAIRPPAARHRKSRPSTARIRPLQTIAGLALAAVLVVVPVLWLGSQESTETPGILYAAVLPPVVEGSLSTGDPELTAYGIRVAAQRGLLNLSGVAALSLNRVDQAENQVGRAKLRSFLAVNEFVQPALLCAEMACQVTLSRIRSEDETTVWTDTFHVLANDPAHSARVVASRLARSYPQRLVRQRELLQEVDPVDYYRYLELRNQLNTRQASLEEVRAKLSLIRESSPRFADVYSMEADILREQFFDSRRPDQLRESLALAQKAHQLAPHDPTHLRSLFQIALEGGRLEIAREAVAGLEDLMPMGTEVAVRRALLLEREGKGEAALRIMENAIARFPSGSNLFNLANLQYRWGRLEEARQNLGLLLDRFPQDYRATSFLAQLELAGGDPQRAASLYEELVKRKPEYKELDSLGLSYFLMGRYEKAVENFSRALDLVPTSPVATLNLADALQMVGENAESVRLYQQVIDKVERDPSSAEQWQMLTVKAQAWAHLGEERKAVTSVQRALRLSPENPQAAFEAALVYVLVGDETSALVNAENAVRGGFERRWFSLPWFEPLMKDVQFLRLVGAPTDTRR